MRYCDTTMNLDELQAYIDEVCREDDRLRAERQWQAERRLKDASLVRKSAPDVADENALQCTQPVMSAAPSTDEERWVGWERWLRGHLDIERGNLIEALGGALSDTSNDLLDRIEPQLEKQSG